MSGSPVPEDPRAAVTPEGAPGPPAPWLRHRYGAVTSDDVAALDAAATRAGVDVVALMEVAGLQVARCAWRMVGRRRARIAVVAGRGNNGGDGLVAARHLVAWGCQVRCVVVGGEERLRDTVVRQRAAAQGAGAVVVTSPLADDVRRTLDGADLVVDALLGTGLRSAPREPDAAAIAATAGARVLSVDVPSGLDATTGEAFTPCVGAEVTCTLTAVKAGFWSSSARPWIGRVVVADIGMPATAWQAVGLASPVAVRGGTLIRVLL